MTIARLSASPLYAARVLHSEDWARLQASFPLRSPHASWRKPNRSTTSERVVAWAAPFLTLLGTVMWFVITNGWFQLCALWSS